MIQFERSVTAMMLLLFVALLLQVRHDDAYIALLKLFALKELYINLSIFIPLSYSAVLQQVNRRIFNK